MAPRGSCLWHLVGRGVARLYRLDGVRFESGHYCTLTRHDEHMEILAVDEIGNVRHWWEGAEGAVPNPVTQKVRPKRPSALGGVPSRAFPPL